MDAFSTIINAHRSENESSVPVDLETDGLTSSAGCVIV